MNLQPLNKRLIFVVLVLCLMTLACNAIQTTRTNELRTDNRTIEMESATSANVRIVFAAGELSLQGGANSLMDATFQYNVDEWKPKVDYSESGPQGNLSVVQQGEKIPIGDILTNDWEIHLSDNTPMGLVIRTGAGKSDLNLNGLSLDSLEIDTGAGSTNIDLTGNWDQDFNVDIKGGVGEITIKLPSDTGVRVQMDTALVSVTANGLIKDGDDLVNTAYGNSAHTINLKLNAGIGSVLLEVP